MTQTPNVNVLVVDDEDGIRKVEQRLLESAGYKVVGARDGAEAMEIAGRGEQFDLVVADMAMPVMDGNQMAEQMRARQPELKVLYVTGHADRLFDSKPLLAADEAFLDKPFSRRGLLEAVSLLMTGRVPSDATPALRGGIPSDPVRKQILVWDF